MEEDTLECIRELQRIVADIREEIATLHFRIDNMTYSHHLKMGVSKKMVCENCKKLRKKIKLL
jgi:hypothetical protein